MKQSQIILITILQLFLVNQAFASLIISPNRVIFEQRERAKSVTVINSSTSTKTYRFSLVDKQQVASGQYKNIDENRDNIPGLYPAASMIRFSPRQVTLKADERQKIRLSLRKPNNLASGEYRTHLKLTQLPSPGIFDTSPTASKIQIHMLTSFTIPIQIRNGTPDVQAKITNAELLMTDVKITNTSYKKSLIMNATITRTGDYASVGKITIYRKPSEEGSYEKVAMLDNATIYRELNQRNFEVIIPDDRAKPGIYKVVYEATKPFPKKVHDEIIVSYP